MMKRRELLQSFAFLAFASGLSSNGVARSFSQNKPWLIGFEGTQADYLPLAMEVNGKWPDELQGTLYRNGPGLSDRRGENYQHWFDGDGMIQAYSIAEQKINHRGQFVRTEKFRKEDTSGFFTVPVAGQIITQEEPTKNNDDLNQANTNVILFDKELLALWEGGSAYRLNPETLETLGPKSWAEGLQHVPFSAHPLRDDDGTLWNIGSVPFGAKPQVVIYHILTSGKVDKVQTHQLSHAGYMHAFGMTQHFLILYNSSSVFGEGNTFVNAHHWSQKTFSEFIVLDKNTLAIVKKFAVEPGFVFHFANALEKNDELHVRFCRYEDDSIMVRTMAHINEFDTPYNSPPFLESYRLNLRNGKVVREKTDSIMEFSGIDNRFRYQQQKIYGVSESKLKPSALMSRIISMDIKTAKEDAYDYGIGMLVEEPLFVPKKNGGLGQGYLVHTLLDYKHKRTGIAVLDAEHIHQGPIATGWMNRVVPLGFHGCFLSQNTHTQTVRS